MAVTYSFLLTEFLGTIFVILAGVYIYFKYFLYSYWRKKGVVYLEPTLPAGNMMSVIRGKISIGELYADAYARQKNNRYFGMYVFYKPTLIIADPDLIRFILTKEFGHFHDRGLYCNEQVDPLSGQLFLLPGKKWRNLRAKLTPTFTSRKLKEMFATILEAGDRLTRYLKPKADKREIIEVKDLFARYGTDVIMSTAFGITSDSLENPNSEFRYWGQKAFELQPFWSIVSLFAPRIMDFFSLPFNDKGVADFFTKVFKETLKYREKNNITRPDFMNLIMQLMKRGYVDGDNDDEIPSIADVPDGKITLLEGVAQAFVFFLAGFETTASTITYVLYEMACNQDIQDKVMEDIDSTIEKFGGFTYESLQAMTYLHKVLAETLRKYPAVTLLNRICTKDVDLPTTNFHVSKGLDIVIPLLGLHRDPEIYPNPDKFDPERFNEKNIAARHPYAYLPFGEGPRICIGMRFSYSQTKMAIVSTLLKYRVKLAPNTQIPLEYGSGGIVLTAKGGIDLIIEPR